jgi:hypothetical protein
MDDRTAAVEARIDDLRRLSAELHFEREVSRPRASGLNRLRLALGRRLVSFGTSLMGERDGAVRMATGR